MPDSMLVASYRDGQWQLGDWPALDRGTQFGDGLFETMNMSPEGHIPLWHYHQARLDEGLTRLNFPEMSLAFVQQALTSLFDSALADAIQPLRQQVANQTILAKLIVSRSSFSESSSYQRGYGYADDQKLNLQIQLSVTQTHDHSSGLTVGVNPIRLARQPLLAGIKHLNRLEQVLARGQFQEGWHESLMLNDQGHVIEGCMSNLYLLEQGELITPKVDECGINGVLRRWMLDQQPVPCREDRVSLDRVYTADALLMSNSVSGFRWVSRLDEHSYAREISQHTQQQCQQALENYCHAAPKQWGFVHA